MDSTTGTGGWIAAYIEWTEAGEREIPIDPPAAGVPEESACSSEEIVAAYLMWMDAMPRVLRFGLGRRASDSVRHALLANDTDSLGVFRETILFTALRTEADCLHILRRAVDTGDSAPRTVQLAFEALQDAEKLLEDEQRAWGALSLLRRDSRCGPYAAPGSDLPGDWPQAFEGVAADVRALAGKVLALQHL